jgi:hypothetical protein
MYNAVLELHLVFQWCSENRTVRQNPFIGKHPVLNAFAVAKRAKSKTNIPTDAPERLMFNS